MTPRAFLALLGAAVLLVAAASWLGTQRGLPRDPDFGAPVLPGLEAELAAVERVRLVGAGERALVTLERRNGRWWVAEPGYPADAARVNRLLLALARLRVTEPKTRDPARWSQLGVEDLATPEASGVRIELAGASRPHALLVGRDAGAVGSFARVPGEPQALEVRPPLDVAREPAEWLARTIVDLPAERVHALAVARAGERPWRAARPARAAAFEFTGLPAGREPGPAPTVEALAKALGNLEFESLERAEAAPPAAAGEPADRASYRSFDGLVLEFEGRRGPAGTWLALAARFDAELAARHPGGAGETAPDAEAVRAEAERLATQAAGWWYRVPPFRYDAVFRPLADFTRPR